MYRFGPFVADGVRGVLTRDGTTVSLTGKCFELLLQLLKHRPATVSKDDLMKAVWADTFVEESNLTQHISLLRRALGEGPQDRLYIVTVPGRGYRFVARVEETEHEAAILMGADAVELVPAEVAGLQPVYGDADEAQPSRTRGVRLWVFAVAAVFTCVGMFALWMHRENKVEALGEKDTVLLTDFVNETAEPVFDGALREGMAVDLAQSPFVTLVDRERVQETLGFMGRSPDEPVRGRVAREVCERLGAKALISGSVSRLGSSYVIGIEAEDCAKGTVLAREQGEAKTREDVLPTLDTLSAHLRRGLGESLRSVQQFNSAMAEATTSSLEALKTYSIAVELRMRGQERKALPFLEHAVELDPKFAMAYAQLGTAYSNLGESERAADATNTAFGLRERLSEQEKLFVTAKYHTLVTGDIVKATETYRIWTQLYPRSWAAFSGLATRYLVLGRYAEAKEAAEQALALQPDNYAPYAVLAGAHLSLNEREDAERVCQRANAVGRDGVYTHRVLFDVAFLRYDDAAMEREVTWAKANGYASEMLGARGSAFAAMGEFRKARALLEESWSTAGDGGRSDSVAYSKARAALAAADLGEQATARSWVRDALRTGSGIDAEMTAAEVFAMLGDEDRARAIVYDLRQRFPHHAPLISASLAASLAILELHHHQPASAIGALERAAPYDFSEFANLSPPYIRGQAYLAAKSGRDAAAQFQLILDHPGVDAKSQRHSLAQLGLSRAYLLMGEPCRSRRSYETFLEQWSRADTDLPELRRARQEYGSLYQATAKTCH